MSEHPAVKVELVFTEGIDLEPWLAFSKESLKPKVEESKG
jgi:hypothetical protein